MKRSWRVSSPDINQTAFAATCNDGRTLLVVLFEVAYKDHHGWHVSLREKAGTVYARWRWRSLK